MQSAKRLEYKNPTDDYIPSSVSSNMVDDNDEIVKHKPKANDNGMEKNPLPKLHVHLVVCRAFIEAGSVIKQNGALRGLKSNYKGRDILAPGYPNCSQPLQRVSRSLPTTHPSQVQIP